MKTSIIGYSGFVGKNLCDQRKFDLYYNSKNIDKFCEVEHDIVFCAAPSAEKWIANKEPVKDLEKIFNLINCLKNAKIKKLILFSTVDVYGNFLDKDEDFLIDIKKIHPYGRNRFILETFLSELFDTSVIRLPALFGNHLKKNIIFDLLNNNMISNISKNTSYQWFYLKDLMKEINFVMENDIKLFNCVPESVDTDEIMRRHFREKIQLCSGNSNINYNIKTKYKSNGFIKNKIEVLKDLESFIHDFNNKSSLE